MRWSHRADIILYWTVGLTIAAFFILINPKTMIKIPWGREEDIADIARGVVYSLDDPQQTPSPEEQPKLKIHHIAGAPKVTRKGPRPGYTPLQAAGPTNTSANTDVKQIVGQTHKVNASKVAEIKSGVAKAVHSVNDKVSRNDPGITKSTAGRRRAAKSKEVQIPVVALLN